VAFTIMIVDDSPVMRSFIGRIVRLSGLDIDNFVEANDGAEALAQLQQGRVDVILTDINMPHVDGEEFVRRLKQSSTFSSIPIVVVSTDRTEHRVKRMLELGAEGYVTKPFSPETLRGEMELVMERVHGCREL
jgi:two-component system chemotaxis response regulator CheY